jgi:hypothetical protein
MDAGDVDIACPTTGNRGRFSISNSPVDNRHSSLSVQFGAIHRTFNVT